MRPAPHLLLAAGVVMLAAAAAFALTRRDTPAAAPSVVQPASADDTAEALSAGWTAIAAEAAPDTGDACAMVAEKPLGPPLPGDTVSYPEVDTVATLDVRGERRFVCPFHAGRTLAVETSAGHWDVVDSLRVLLPGRAPQVLRATDEASAPSRSEELLRAPDLDGDGYRDLMLLSWVSGQGNTKHDVWLYRPREAAFAYDSTISENWNLRPLGGGCYEAGAYQGGGNRWHGKFCRVNGREVQMSSETLEWDAAAELEILTTQERRGDTLVVVRVDTLRDPR